MTRSLAVCLSFALCSSIWAADHDSIVYDFSASWCGPCQQMAPLVEKLKREGLPIRKVDIDKEKSLAEKYNISSIPTFVVVVNGKEVQRQSGAMTETSLRQMIAKIPEDSPGNIAAADSPNGINLGASAPMHASASEGRANTEDNHGIIVRGNDSETEAAENKAAEGNLLRSADPMDSSVRIRVTINGKVNLGSGTIIESQAGLTKILTCAHIFRGFDNDSKIEVDLNINNRERPYIAKLVDFNEQADLGLISVATSSLLPVAEIAAVTNSPVEGDAVEAIGCSGGDAPTREKLQVTEIDRYKGPHNIECTGLPVRGRSGGGLFDGDGNVVGVCIAADKEQKRGLYSGLFAIHTLLEENQLAHLIPDEIPASEMIADTTPQEMVFPENPVHPGTPGPGAFPGHTPLTENDIGTELNTTNPMASAGVAPLDLATGGAEVVVIIRDRNNPQQQNRVVILHNASSKFMSYLDGELTSKSGTPVVQTPLPQPIRPIVRTVKSDEAKLPLRLAVGDSSIGTSSRLQQTTLSQPIVPRKYVRGDR